MSGKTFVDTNVLIYAHDSHAGRKQETAARVLEELWDAREGVLSAQVLQEFYVNVTRKIPAPLSRGTARGILGIYSSWTVEVAGPREILRASEIEERYRIGFWDALIVATAAKAGAKRILSEDMNSGQVIEGLRLENPFAADSRK